MAAAAAAPAADPPPKRPLGTPANLPALLRSFSVHPGFKLELVAAEPLVVDPVAMAFDENGRLFVVEMRPHPGRTNAFRGRIRLLEDQDGDGTFDVSSVYADELDNPSAIVCYDGGVFVGAGTEILYLKDSHHDGNADVRRVVVSRHGTPNSLVDGRYAFTSLVWGLDNWIHVATAGTGGEVLLGEAPGSVLTLEDGDFAFDPRRGRLRGEGGAGAGGLALDSLGRKFVTEPRHPYSLVMTEPRYAPDLPAYERPPTLQPLAQGGYPTPLYPHPGRGAGAPAARGAARPEPAPACFTAAGGPAIYRGTLFGPGYAEDVFVPDAAAGVVHRAKLQAAGPGLVAVRAPEEAQAEFLAGGDPAFQPVQVVAGPEGALYIADFARPGPGGPRGRIYRIVPARFEQPEPWAIGELSTPELVTCLRHTDGWDRDTAARLLYERQDRAAVGPLGKLVFTPGGPWWSRLHALRALEGIGALAPGHVQRGLADPDERVRAQAVLLTENFLGTNAVVPALLADSLTRLGDDPSVRVRYQLACTLGLVREPDPAPALLTILGHDPASAWVQGAVAGAAGAGPAAVPVFAAAANNEELRRSPTGLDFLSRLTRMIGGRGRPPEIAQTLAVIGGQADAAVAFRLFLELDQALLMATNSLELADPGGARGAIFARARRVAADGQAPDATRTAAFEVLGLGDAATAGDFLLPFIFAAPPPDWEAAAIAALGRIPDDRLAAACFQRWAFLTPTARRELVGILLNRPDRTKLLLAGIRDGRIPRAFLTAGELRFLGNHPDPDVAEAARKLLGPPPPAAPVGAPAGYAGAADLPGNARHGRELFQARCAKCHRFGPEGGAAALELAPVGGRNRATLLTGILDSQSAASPLHPQAMLRTRSHGTVGGLVLRQTTNSIVLREARGQVRVIPRHAVQFQANLAGDSPHEALAAGLGVGDLADLLEFLVRANP